MQSIAITIFLMFSSFFLGVISLVGYFVWRMLRSDEWDDSNVFNALRLLAHVTFHPEDFGRMIYPDPLAEDEVEQANHPALAVMNLGEDGEDDYRYLWFRRPFWYIALDELDEVVASRVELPPSV